MKNEQLRALILVLAFMVSPMLLFADGQSEKNDAKVIGTEKQTGGEAPGDREKVQDIQAWEAEKGLDVIGMNFISCGCDDPGLIPTDRSEFKSHLRNVLFLYRETLQRWKQDIDSNTEKRIEAIVYWNNYWNNRIEAVEKELSKIT